jgi:hypothetical protein
MSRFNTLLASLLVVSASAFAPSLGELLLFRFVRERRQGSVRRRRQTGCRSFELHLTLSAALLTRRLLQM